MKLESKFRVEETDGRTQIWIDHFVDGKPGGSVLYISCKSARLAYLHIDINSAEEFSHAVFGDRRAEPL